MTLTSKTPKTWACRCGHRNEPTHRKCRGCGKAKPKRRVPKHARTLRDDTYELYEAFSAQVHGGDHGACALCGKPKPETYRHERDHGHKRDEHAFGRPRGILCTYCNKERVGHLSLMEARLVVAYLERVEAFYATRENEA